MLRMTPMCRNRLGMKRPIWKGPTIRINFNNEKAIWKGNSTLPDLLKGAIKFSYQEGKAS